MKTTLYQFIIILCMIIVLLFLGRVAWCACGSLNPFSLDPNSMHNSQHFLDLYSLSHFLHGILFFAILYFLPVSSSTKLILATLLEASWEVLENSPFIINRYRTVTIALNYYGDSILNSCGDVFSCLVGFWFAKKYSTLVCIVTFIGIELFLLWYMRDNLTLNILMLTFPSEAVKAWQSQI